MKSNEAFKLSSLIPKISETPPLMFEKFTGLFMAPNEEPWDSVRAFYENKSPGIKAIGMIINGAITNKKKTFLFSQRIHNEWLRMHSYSLGQDVSGQVYKKILAQVLDPELGIVRCVQQPSRNNGNNRRAGIYEIIHEGILDHIKNTERFVDERMVGVKTGA